MASSELEVEPDLKKAPPHVEGELLKQNTRSLFSHKAWKKYFFIVLKDKLQYFFKREDSKQNKEPVAFIRMSQVTCITEVVFNGVPKKHHLNCGFSVEAFHPVSQQQITLNLLAETPEDMRYWVHALRYIKAYWAKKMIRETVLNEEQERKILERILSGDLGGGEDELIAGEYTLDGDSGSLQSSLEYPSCPVGTASMVFFADGSKVKVSLLPTDTASDLLDKEEVKEHLTSSAAYIWLVDSLGSEMILGPSDNPGLFPGKTHKLYALDHSHRVLPVFVSKKEYECIVVSAGISAQQIMEHHDICVLLDLNGVNNRGLFLKTDTEECMFTGTECPCDVLFDEDEGRSLVRQDVGKLVIHNKSIGGGRGSNVTRHLKTKKTMRARSFRTQNRILEEISEEEEAQSKALDMLLQKKRLAGGGGLGQVKAPPQQSSIYNIDGEEWVVTGSNPSSPDHRRDSRGFEDTIGATRKGSGTPDLPGTVERRNRSSAISDMKNRSPGGTRKLSNSPMISPAGSPGRGRSKSPRRLPEGPAQSSGGESTPSSPHSSPFQRRNATRAGSLSSARRKSGSGSVSSQSSSALSGSGVQNSSPERDRKRPPTSFMPLSGKGPTIRLTSHDSPVSSPSLLDTSPPLALQRARSPTTRGTIMESINMDMVEQSRSSAFGYTLNSPPAETTPTKYLGEGPDSLSSSPLELHIPTLPTSNDQQEDTPSSPRTRRDSMEVLHPFVIDFTALQVAQLPIDAVEAGKEESAAVGKPLPINVTSPNLLKVVLLQSSEPSDITVEMRPMDLISLSGVVLCNQRGVWQIQQGCNFHDGLPFDSDSHTEMFNLTGGIKVVYNHTHKRWHVLPPGPSGGGGGYDDRSISSSVEQGSSLEQTDGSMSSSVVNQLYLAKKVVVTEVGSAFHDIMALFSKTRDNTEKQRIGSDMTNANMGHLIRGRFCSAVAQLLLDGLRPYRLQGIIQDDIWAVTMAFCNAAQSDPSSSLVTPAIDKLIFQPIHSMKARIKDNNIKFRTFICLAMSKGMLTGWLEALPKQRSVLRKYYLPSSFLSLAADDASFNALYQEMLLTLEPMIYLPFDLSIDFELRQASTVGGVAQQGAGPTTGSGETSLSVSSATGERPVSPQSPLRANVVIKTHAATGQRSAAGNVINAVWDTSSIHSSPGSGQDAMATSPSHHTEETDSAAEGPKQEAVVSSVIADPPTANQPQSSVKKVGGSFLKKISDRFQQLNAGGAITGAPKGIPHSQNNNHTHKQEPHPQKDASSPAPSKGARHVEALYTNICDDNDELCFSKGDLLVVKEQINTEWLICSHGNRTGIVPVNYIKPVTSH